jgi:hypothetical protein
MKTSIIQNLPNIIAAIGGLGTAAFGLVDAVKPCGVNHIGFTRISQAVETITTTNAQANDNQNNAQLQPANAIPQGNIVASLKANWYNGTDLGSQKSIAKSLIKMRLSEGNAANLASATGINAAALKSVATKISSGTKLETDESDVFARFDFGLTALLDELYQHADQVYRNWTRILAAAFAITLALLGGWTLHANLDPTHNYLWSNDMAIALIVGFLAIPLAPIAKDLSTALSTAVNTLQLVKK